MQQTLKADIFRTNKNSGRVRVIYKSLCTVRPVKNGHSRIDKIKILMTNGSLMKVESIAEAFDLH